MERKSLYGQPFLWRVQIGSYKQIKKKQISVLRRAATVWNNVTGAARDFQMQIIFHFTAIFLFEISKHEIDLSTQQGFVIAN